MKITLDMELPNALVKHFRSFVDREGGKQVEKLATFTEGAIKRNITTTSAMPTGKLADAFFKEQISSLDWGIGDINYLNSNAEHWRHINYGSLAIGANWEHYLPTGQWGINGRFLRDPTGSSGLIPKTPIQAHNYIEKTFAELDMEIKQL